MSHIETEAEELEPVFSRIKVPVSAVSPIVDKLARKNRKELLQKLRIVGLKSVGDFVGKDIGTISRWGNEDGFFTDVCRLLASMDLQIAPSEHKLYPAATIEKITQDYFDRMADKADAESEMGE